MSVPDRTTDQEITPILGMCTESLPRFISVCWQIRDAAKPFCVHVCCNVHTMQFHVRFVRDAVEDLLPQALCPCEAAFDTQVRGPEHKLQSCVRSG